LDSLVHFLSSLDPFWIYVVIFSIAFIENIFPPSPSDIIVVFGGALAAMEKGNFFAALAAGTLGSTLGFMTMYIVGRWFGRRILETGRLRFVNMDALHKLERWFTRYGYWIIVANRFLSGTRAVISFFAGMSELELARTTLLSFFGSLLWYAILVFSGYKVGEHWQEVGEYLKSYGEIVSAASIVILLAFVIRYYYKKRKAAA